jgi:hypothetical protein
VDVDGGGTVEEEEVVVIVVELLFADDGCGGGGGVLIGIKSLSNWFDGEFKGANCWKEFDEVEFPFEFLGKALPAF